MTKREAFTLIEVMVAVMIVSVVVAALLEMRGNLSHKIFSINKTLQVSQYDTFLLLQNKYGFQRSSTNMKTLSEDFELETDLRRKLSALKLHIDYDTLNVIDTSELNEGATLIFEVGKTKIKSTEYSSAMTRVRIQ